MMRKRRLSAQSNSDVKSNVSMSKDCMEKTRSIKISESKDCVVISKTTEIKKNVTNDSADQKSLALNETRAIVKPEEVQLLSQMELPAKILDPPQLLPTRKSRRLSKDLMSNKVRAC